MRPGSAGGIIYLRMNNIAIFASGSGTNAQRISEYFSAHPSIRVKLIFCNNPSAHVIRRAEALGIPCELFDRRTFSETGHIVSLLGKNDISLIVLAGFLWLIPPNLLKAYKGKIINIHPALLPKYGGRGMYGSHVHEAVIRSGDKESGISIHHVNEKYDDGSIIFQSRCPVLEGDSVETLAGRIHELEYRYYPEVIERLLESGF
jgi:phosphoribosylglycinamide formyltransferase-1